MRLVLRAFNLSLAALACLAVPFAATEEVPVPGSRFVLVRAFDYQQTRVAEFAQGEGAERVGLTALVRGCQRGQGTITMLLADGERRERWSATGQELHDLLAVAACRPLRQG